MKELTSWRTSSAPFGGKIRLAFLFLLFICLFAAGVMRVFSNNIMRYLLQIFLYISLGEAWNMLSGFAGMTSLGQQLYVGLAGYSMTIVTTLWGMPFFLGLLLGMVVSMLTAAVLSRILFRMKGMYFAIATWVTAEAAEKIFLSWKYVNQGGGMTVRIVPYPDIFRIYIMALMLCAVILITVAAVLRSRLGLSLTAIRDDSDAAVSIGINLYRTKLAVYLMSAMMTALVGGVFFINKGVIYPESGFSVSWTVSAVFICIIGGTGTISGPVIGAVLYVLLQEFLAHYPGWSNIILGLTTILMIRFLPGGIISLFARKNKCFFLKRVKEL